MSEILQTIITALVGVLAGNIMALLTLPQTRSLKKIENEAKQSEEWKKLYIDQKNEAIERDRKIDELYQQISMHRDENAKLHVENEQIKIENERLKIIKCLKPGCQHRDPPSLF